MDNLTNETQFFSCLPRSHFYEVGGITPKRLLEINSGFATLKCPNQKKFCKNNRTLVAIPPLQSIFFFQHLLHEVVSKKSKNDQYRIFHGIRVTVSESVLFQKQYAERNLFERQGTPLLPSGQECVLFGGNHASIFAGPVTTDDWA